jgi:hypothetical protein
MSHGLRGQVLFLLIVRLGVKSFTHGHLVNLVIVLSVPVVMALQSQFPPGCGVRCHLFLLSVCLELKSLADSHIVGIVLDAITPVLVPRDATILVIALHTLTILEVALQNVIGVELELQGTTVAVGTLRNTDVPNITIPIHLADSIALCLRNVDFQAIVAAVAILPLEPNLQAIVAAVAILLLEPNPLAICLYPLAVLLHPFLDVNLDLFLSHQQFAERVQLIRHHPSLVDHWRAKNMNQSLFKCHHVLKPPCGGLHQVFLMKKPVLILLQ